MIDIPCADELQGWLGAIAQFLKERKEIDDRLAEQWAAEDEAHLICPSSDFSIMDPDQLPAHFLDLADPPFNIPIPHTSSQDRLNFDCLDLQMTARDRRAEVNDLFDIHEMTPAIIDENFEHLQECVRHLFDAGGP